MLGYPTVFMAYMYLVNRHLSPRNIPAARCHCPVFAILFIFFCAGPLTSQAAAQQAHLPFKTGGVAELSSSGPQSRRGDLYIADGDVDILYGDSRLRADHVEYNEKTSEALARGHVQFDFENQHMDADEAHYNVKTGHGVFHNVRGTVKIERRPNPSVLLSDNPLYFQARDVERLPRDVYVIDDAWITICDPEHPTWQFFAPHARVRLDRTVALVNANFRVFRVPLVWLPYATAPAGKKVRQSGFLIPDVGDSSRKGFTFGEAFYWAPKPWLDTTLGAQYMSRRGAATRGELRAKPLEGTSVRYTYFGVDDRGLLVNGVRQPQGGEQQRLEIESQLRGGWRFVADYNHLSSLTFRLAFADTFGEAINSEVRSAFFLTNNFRGFSLNFAALNDKSFLQINPATGVALRNLPEARFDSVEQAPWRKLPVYFGLESFADAVHRSDSQINTPSFVGRTEFAPRVTVPIHFGSWLGVTASAAFRSTRYGASLSGPDEVSERAIVRNTGEFTVDLRPPTLERFFDRPKAKRRYKHSIEPVLTYRYVTGVNNFADFIRFDSDSTITDTNEVEYGVTQRFFVKDDGDEGPRELISWRLVQKHFFDPTFGGAAVPGRRNVFQALNSITPFAFALGPVHWSPIVSDFTVAPGSRYDVEQILEYDPTIEKLTTIGTLLKIKPYSQYFVTVAHFRLDADPILQPLSNQVRALFGYGSLNGRGFSAAAGISYDLTNGTLQNQLMQVSYNGSCCGLALEYRRIALGQVRTENQFRVAFIIANIGTFGNLRRQEKIY
ncbi:MAG: LPS assembly protein LptD [Acidobacteriota bacterium]|nr:LPS assembly protein LptD [Acidobacteriota bacterium]